MHYEWNILLIGIGFNRALRRSAHRGPIEDFVKFVFKNGTIRRTEERSRERERGGSDFAKRIR